MKERPIIMGAESVRAILEGRKTQTRRVVKHIPALGWVEDWCHRIDNADLKHIVGDYRRFCPYGKVGDRLWVRETWSEYSQFSTSGGIDVWKCYKADDSDINDYIDWKSPIFMSRSMSRITLEIIDIRVERVQDITPEDALKEGFCNYGTDVDTLDAFCEAWQKLNSKRGYPWESNPWVWVVEFKVVENGK